MSQFPDPDETPAPDEEGGNIPDIWDIKTSGKGRVGRADTNLDEAMPDATDSEPYLEGDSDTPGLWNSDDLSSYEQGDYLETE
ncbi:hypothetical protein SAMN05192574_103281 [Mucilaginibacter gossypiicola]|uniref:Uncharacterized protein n=1 Tax=Mucilaginibacter gossypiicola TaxID=551995 RepID=A0A1H8GVV7_9SPHI|nr:hypothetical protein [Mucilaginibacter gossypiicola]SEN47607.1 hypothetical protein SAMN05192574_103281 [Mucilaginibacter gossypiicola]